MARIELTVKMNGVYSYTRAAYGYGYETAYIYNMEAEDGTVYVWKTTAVMAERVQTESAFDYAEIDSKGRKWVYNLINKDDVVRIKATVKGQSEYKGQPQTELTRVAVVERIFAAETWEEKMARKAAEEKAKAKEQIESLSGEDFAWRMPYKQYKEHYSDCETVAGSFESASRNGVATIIVIVREGRLKASGVRGMHYSGYRLQNEAGELVTYRAVSEETAIRRANSEFPNHEWEVIKVFRYNNY